jgi:DNA topoisomerase VI subunit A
MEADFVLVLEKECLLQRLVDDRVQDLLFHGRCLLVTVRRTTFCHTMQACGFPDDATRVIHCCFHWLKHQMLLSQLALQYTNVPFCYLGGKGQLIIHDLTDCDPFGMSVWLTYKTGNKVRESRRC